MRKNDPAYFGDFRCIYCRHYVSANTGVSGVVNRNHCPYCLHSRHLDLKKAGDRLSACKAGMKPVGLAIKRTNKKYGENLGELLLIHRCIECDKISINRIAADDIAEYIFEVFEQSRQMDAHTRMQIEMEQIHFLQPWDEDIVQARLFGGAKNAYLEYYQDPVNSLVEW
jgi:hypothetical protein